MKALSIVCTFAAGLAVALAVVVLRPGGDSVTMRSDRPGVEGRSDEGSPGAHRRLAVAGSEADASARREPPGRRRESYAKDEDRESRGPAPEAAGGAGDTRAATLEAELMRMSPGYRDRVFLQEIRERGYYCRQILETQLGSEDVVVWSVTCDTGSFLLSAASGELRIERVYHDPDPGAPPSLLEPAPRWQQRLVPKDIE